MDKNCPFWHVPIVQGGNKVDELDIFNKLKIGIASDEKIREW